MEGAEQKVSSTSASASTSNDVLVSVIIPVHNSEAFLLECLDSVAAQTYPHCALEVCIFDDGSTDASGVISRQWLAMALDQYQIQGRMACLNCLARVQASVASGTIDLSCHCSAQNRAKGAGFARNAAVSISRGTYLCFLDSDDIMLERRVELQLSACQRMQSSLGIVGSRFRRLPHDATERYSRWCNDMAKQPLLLFWHRFRDCTLIQPTWFMSRTTFEVCGGYPNDVLAEDLLFMYRVATTWLKQHDTPALEHQSALFQSEPCYMLVDEPLLIYRYRGESSLTHRVSKDLLRRVRVQALEQQVLCRQPYISGFGIWGAGKNGRSFFRQLSPEFQQRVTCFYDIDPNKLKKPYNQHDPKTNAIIRSIPILSAAEVKPPFVTCVSLDRTDGEFEDSLAQHQLEEGRDYIVFS